MKAKSQKVCGYTVFEFGTTSMFCIIKKTKQNVLIKINEFLQMKN